MSKPVPCSCCGWEESKAQRKRYSSHPFLCGICANVGKVCATTDRETGEGTSFCYLRDLTVGEFVGLLRCALRDHADEERRTR